MKISKVAEELVDLESTAELAQASCAIQLMTRIIAIS